MSIYKTCTKCKEAKELELFKKDSANKDGYHYHCKECAQKAQREYRLNNLEEVTKRDNAERLKHKRSHQVNVIVTARDSGGVKECSHCKETKELSEFNKQKDQKCGYRSQCKECMNAIRSLRRKNTCF